MSKIQYKTCTKSMWQKVPENAANVVQNGGPKGPQIHKNLPNPQNPHNPPTSTKIRRNSDEILGRTRGHSGAFPLGFQPKTKHPREIHQNFKEISLFLMNFGEISPKVW